MNVPRRAQLAARLLRQGDPARGAAGGDRERGLVTIERALAAQVAAPRRGLRVAVAASVAAAALGWLVARTLGEPSSLQEPARLISIVAWPMGSGASFLDSTGEVPLGDSLVLRVGGRVATAPAGGARLQLSTGTRLEMQELTSLTVQSQDVLQRFALARGGLDAKVAKLARDERFVIDTPDAQVEVRGTAFRLEVLPNVGDCGEGNRTRLEVTEGVVEVRAGGAPVRVGAGEHWPADCERPSLEVAPPSAAGGALSGPGKRGAAGARASTADSDTRLEAPPPRRPPRSRIAEQNALFQRGVQAQRRGDTESARAAYVELIERFPSSPLAENAWVAQLRMSISLDPARARRDARSYLALYPHGFARVEAQRLVEGQ